MDKRTADALLRAIATPAGSRVGLNQTLRAYLAENAVGTIRGQGVTFTMEEQKKLREHLRGSGFGNYLGGSFGGMTRTERLASVANEKLGGGTVRRDRIAIKAMGGHALMIAGKTIDLPPGSHLDIAWPVAAESIPYKTAIVVENWEAFEGMDQVAISQEISMMLSDMVAVYRGDTDTKGGDVLRFLEATGMKTLAYVDLDPAGLLIAANLPSLVGVLAPAEKVIRELLRSPDKARPDRYGAQAPMAREQLDALAPEHPVSSLWTIVWEARSAVMQERLAYEKATLSVWS